MLSVIFKSQKFATIKISQNSVVGTGWMITGSNSGRGKRFLSLFSKSPERLWGPSSLLLNGNRGSFQALRRQGREVKHSPPAIAYVKNEWSYTCTSPCIPRPWTQTTVSNPTCTYAVTVYNSDAVNRIPSAQSVGQQSHKTALITSNGTQPCGKTSCIFRQFFGNFSAIFRQVKLLLC